MVSRAGWRKTVSTALALQWLVILVLGVIAWIWSGDKGAGSVFLGGAAVAVPNALFAAWLTIRLHQTGTLGVIAMLMGELFKLGLTLALLTGVIIRFKADLVWLALLAGVIGALKAQWLALWFTRRF